MRTGSKTYGMLDQLFLRIVILKMMVVIAIIYDKEICDMDKSCQELNDFNTDGINDLPELTAEEADIIERQIDDLYEGPVFQRKLEAYYETRD